MQKESEKRCRGRPQIRSDEETRELILDVADDQFKKAGYAAASISMIAQTAGVSTKTLYRLFPAKADLFSSVISKKIKNYILALDTEGAAETPLQESLEKLLISYGRLTLSEETIAMTRLVLSESDRFPEIAAIFYEQAIRKTSKAIENWLKKRMSSGQIELDDPGAATGMLRGMMAMEPQRAVMLGQLANIPDAEIISRAQTCTKLFLQGCKRQ
ncbi:MULTISPECIES: TetR/AcrR family transcriptional regulator [Rhizobium]|jgi:AcrR family transcriptional regulator|nr:MULTISPECIES: TetR/AcrR family transcriptional regulator [Rhizobium]MBB3424455.1 AcrR family transcriptional regulator [Rhizobium sp. BK312]